MNSWCHKSPLIPNTRPLRFQKYGHTAWSFHHWQRKGFPPPWPPYANSCRERWSPVLVFENCCVACVDRPLTTGVQSLIVKYVSGTKAFEFKRDYASGQDSTSRDLLRFPSHISDSHTILAFGQDGCKPTTVIYPIFDHPLNVYQFTWCSSPSGRRVSTTCALNNLNHTLADLLQIHSYVHLIALDSLQSIRYCSLTQSCWISVVIVPILDSLYNWLAGYLEYRQHITKFGGMLSELKRIIASIVQGSGFGPTEFVLTSSDLRVLSLLILLNKYADDCYLIRSHRTRPHLSQRNWHM